MSCVIISNYNDTYSFFKVKWEFFLNHYGEFSDMIDCHSGLECYIYWIYESLARYLKVGFPGENIINKLVIQCINV